MIKDDRSDIIFHWLTLYLGLAIILFYPGQGVIILSLHCIHYALRKKGLTTFWRLQYLLMSILLIITAASLWSSKWHSSWPFLRP